MMHEMSLVRDIVDVVTSSAEKNHVQGVRTIYLTIGRGRDVVPELFDALFKHLSMGTIVEGAEIVIDNPPYMVRCGSCGMTYHINTMDSSTWGCPVCNERDYSVVSGMEFSIDRIEVI